MLSITHRKSRKSLNDTNTLIIKKDPLTNVGQVAVEVIGFTLKIMDGTGPRNVPGTVCILLDKQELSLRPQAKGQVPRMGIGQ